MKANIGDLELATPGSVWKRKNGMMSRLLFITNECLPKDMRKQYPRMAVYLDEDGNCLSTPIAEFLAKRTFYNVDPTLENLIMSLSAVEDTEFNQILNGDNSLIVSDDEQDFEVDEEENGDDDVVVAGVHEVLPSGFRLDTMGRLVAVADSIKPADGITTTDNAHIDATQEPSHNGQGQLIVNPQVDAFPVEYVRDNEGMPDLISSQTLATLTESYQADPSPVGSQSIMHRLFITAAPGVTHQSLYDSFCPTRKLKNTVFSFNVKTAEGVITPEWDTFMGVHPYVFRNQQLYQVVFSSSVEVETDQVLASPAEVTMPADGDFTTTMVTIADAA